MGGGGGRSPHKWTPVQASLIFDIWYRAEEYGAGTDNILILGIDWKPSNFGYDIDDDITKNK